MSDQTDFSHLKKLDPSGRTAEFKLVQLARQPTLTVASATQANKAFLNATLKIARGAPKRYRLGKLNASMLDELRAEDLELFAKHVVLGWQGIRNVSGAEVPFSQENCQAFLSQLPAWLFDELRNFCRDVDNFIDGPTGEEVEALGESSPTA